MFCSTDRQGRHINSASRKQICGSVEASGSRHNVKPRILALEVVALAWDWQEYDVVGIDRDLSTDARVGKTRATNYVYCMLQ